MFARLIPKLPVVNQIGARRYVALEINVSVSALILNVSDLKFCSFTTKILKRLLALVTPSETVTKNS